ncbi:hypothetical protein A2U01_0071271, partial [Trifolium medium]|nr:hypothetical protein [Trifolium medium]
VIFEEELFVGGSSSTTSCGTDWSVAVLFAGVSGF